MCREESEEGEEVNDLSAYQRGREKKMSTRSGKKAWSAELKWNACR